MVYTARPCRLAGQAKQPRCAQRGHACRAQAGPCERLAGKGASGDGQAGQLISAHRGGNSLRAHPIAIKYERGGRVDVGRQPWLPGAALRVLVPLVVGGIVTVMRK